MAEWKFSGRPASMATSPGPLTMVYWFSRSVAPSAKSRLRMYVPMPKSRMRRASIAIFRLMVGHALACPVYLSANGVELPIVEREPAGECFDLLPHRRDHLFTCDVIEHFRNECAHFAHLRFLKSARGDGW